jgi:4-hydroxybenzoyl-CoA thioesterase
MSFKVRTQIRFAHIDAAGIVFYPRFFEMLNGAVEDWFDQDLGWSFAAMHKERKMGVPTVHLETDFVAACELGEWVEISLDVERLGEKSVTLAFAFTVAGERRLGGKVVLVCMQFGVRRALPWPDDLRAGIQRALVNAA